MNRSGVTSNHTDSVEPKQPCRVTVTAPGWHGARAAAIAAGCSSLSELIEKLGRGELAVIASDAIRLDPVATPASTSLSTPPISTRPISTPISTLPTPASGVVPQHVHYHTAASPAVAAVSAASAASTDSGDDYIPSEPPSLPKLVTTGLCAAVIIGSLLYVADRFIAITTGVLMGEERIGEIVTPVTGDIVAGYEVSDEYGIRPFHPVTGAPNVPHNGVDLAMPIGTPIYAVGKAGDTVDVECWWDVDGGGWVVDQTADSFPGYTFQSLHMSDTGCKEGMAKAGDAIAYSGNSGLGTGAHYDFRVKIDNSYVPPATKYLESAVTGEPPKEE